ncbi:MAG: alpha-glucosidase, partial [Okeania sp. SIO3B3]|nr:alpha-glucosidase [Okeania sp. SIO3B3]
SRSSAPQAEVDDPRANDEYRHTKITHSYNSEKMREIKVERVHDNYKPFEEYFFVGILHDPREQRGATGPLKGITINGQYLGALSGETPEQLSQQLQNSGSNAWYYNQNINISFIKVFDYSPSISIQAEYV